jgi:hypothetical protein
MFLGVCTTACALDIVRPLESSDLVGRNGYAFEILTLALRCTVPKYGPFVEIPFRDNLSVKRAQVEAIKGNLINVMISNASDADFNRAMIPIPFPIDKGLLGYRVSFIRDGEQGRFESVETIAQLRMLVVGQGRAWGDVPIYQYNKIPVLTSDSYDGLFNMLVHRRFDMFPRGVIEASDELKNYGRIYQSLRIDDHLLLVYPYANFFYVTSGNPRLARRINDGLEIIHKSGSFDRIFNRYFAKTLEDLHLDRRTAIFLANPYVPSWFSAVRSDLWINPMSYKPQLNLDSNGTSPVGSCAYDAR